MKTKLLTTIAILLTSISFSQTFTVDNISYNVTDTTTNEVEVTGSSLTDIIVPPTVNDTGITYTVTAIAFQAFRNNTNLNSIELGENIESIGDGAFRGSTIALVISSATEPPILEGNLVFADTNDIDKKLTIPEGTEQDYETAGWTRNFEIVNDEFVVGAGFTVGDFTYEATSGDEVSVTEGTGTDISIPDDVTYLGTTANVTAIAENAFVNKTDLNSIVLGENIESIGVGAFRGSTITLVTSNATIAPILEGSVFDNTGDKTLIIPEGDAVITSYEAAGWISNFVIVNDGFGVGAGFTVGNVTYEATSSDEVSVTGATGTDISIPDDVTYLGVTANVTSIVAYAFSERTNLNSIELGENIKSIGDGAFRNSTITSVTSNATEPPVLEGNIVFIGTDDITLVIPEGTVQAYETAGWTSNFVIVNDGFAVGAGFTVDNVTYEATSSDEISVTGATGTDINIPDDVTYLGVTANVTSIAAEAFRGITNMYIINSIELGKNIESIGDGAFRNSTLTLVTSNAINPPTLEGSLIFAETSGIGKELIIPEGTEQAYETAGWTSNFEIVNGEFIIDGTFTVNNIIYKITSDNTVSVAGTLVADISVPNEVYFETVFSVTAVADGGFRNNTVINTIVLEENIKSVGESAFRNSTVSLIISKNATPPTLTGDLVFVDSNEIDKTLIVPSGATQAYINAGWDIFTSIQEKELTGDLFFSESVLYRVISQSPNEVEVFGGTVTGGLTIPGSVSYNNTTYAVTSIAASAFNSAGLTSVILPDSVTSIGVAAFKSNSITTVTLPSGLTALPNQVFWENEIESIVLPQSLITIGNNAFRENNLTSVEIPSKVTSIGLFAFWNNDSLTSVTSKNTTPPSIEEDNSFAQGNIDLTVPRGTRQAYINAGWSNFNSITVADFFVYLSPKVFLEGGLYNPNEGEEHLMRDDLRVAGVLPIRSPYGDGLTISESEIVVAIEGENAIVDWVYVELRNATDNTIVVASQSALLQRDGDIVATDGNSALGITADPGNYLVAVNHRNHLGIISANAVALSSDTTSLDFTSDTSIVEGGSIALNTTDSGVLALILGDFDENELVDGIDISSGIQFIGQSGYNNADLDLNGVVGNIELNSLITPNIGKGQQF